MAATDLLVGLAVLVGLVGIVVPVLPGSILILGAVLVWALAAGDPVGWVVFAVAATFLVLGSIVKYAVPGRGLKAAGVPGRTLVAGGLLGIVGFFVIPVVGAPIGFVLGIYLVELGHSQDRSTAWTSTKAALKAVFLSIGIELLAALAIAVTWVVGVLVSRA